MEIGEQMKLRLKQEKCEQYNITLFQILFFDAALETFMFMYRSMHFLLIPLMISTAVMILESAAINAKSS